MALTGEGEDRAMMHQAIDHGGGGHLIRKHLSPFLKGKIRRQRDATAFVPLRNELEKQIRCFSFERDVAEFIDEHEIDSIQRAVFAFQ